MTSSFESKNHPNHRNYRNYYMNYFRNYKKDPNYHLELIGHNDRSNLRISKHQNCTFNCNQNEICKNQNLSNNYLNDKESSAKSSRSDDKFNLYNTNPIQYNRTHLIQNTCKKFFCSATSQSNHLSKVKQLKKVLDQNEIDLKHTIKNFDVEKRAGDNMIKNCALKHLNHLNNPKRKEDKKDEIYLMNFVEKDQEKHLNNVTKCQMKSKDKNKNLLKIHLFNKTKFDKNRSCSSQNLFEPEFEEKVNLKWQCEIKDDKNSNFKSKLKINSNFSSNFNSNFSSNLTGQRLCKNLGNIKKFILIILSICIMIPYLDASESDTKLENETSIYFKFNESLINSINSLETLDLKINLLNSISPFNKRPIKTIDKFSAIRLAKHSQFNDHLNSTSDNSINLQTENYPNYLNYYKNQISLEGKFNESNNFTVDVKWWLNFFPEKYVDNQMNLSEFLFRIFGVFVCSILICLTLFGNVLTITVVLRFSRMKTVTNILLASLAVADITVALLVMPFLIINDYLRTWPFGAAICHFYISCDVMCCTASIQHLCAVAIDRYWAINKPLHYHRLVNKRRLVFSIVLIWLMSVLISFIPVFSGIYHEKDITASEIFLMNDYPNCYLQVNILYAIFSSTISFYLPLPIMFYVYIRILLIAERQNREIKQLENHLRFNGANYRNSAPAVTSVGSANQDARSSTTNITTNSLPIERHIIQHHQQQLHPQLTIQPPIQLPNQSLVQPSLDLLLHGMPPCFYNCHCAQMNQNQLNDNKKDLKEIKELDKEPNNELNKELNKYLSKDSKSTDLKDANNNNDEQNNLGQNSSELDKKTEQETEKKVNEKTKFVSNKVENPIQRRSKYLNKQFDVTLLNNLSSEDKENDQENDQENNQENNQDNQSNTDKFNQKSSLKKDSLTQSISTPLVLDLSNDRPAHITLNQLTNSNPNLEQDKKIVNQPDEEKKTEEKKPDKQDADKNDLNNQGPNKQESAKQQDINLKQANLPHNHCCCFNQHLIYCAHQLHSKIIQQNLLQQLLQQQASQQQLIQQQTPQQQSNQQKAPQQQLIEQQVPQQQSNQQQVPQQPNIQMQQSTSTANPLTFAQNLLNILSTHFPPLSEHSNELRDGYSSASTSTLNNLTNHPSQQQKLAPQNNDNSQPQNSQDFNSAMQQLTGINIQIQNPQLPNQRNNSLDALQQFNQFLQQNNLTNLICDHNSTHCNHVVQNQSTPIHQQDCVQHQSCCNWSIRKCSDTSTVSGPVQSFSSAASKSMCSSCTQHCYHHPHSLHSWPIYSTNLPNVDPNQSAAISQHANVQFDVNSLTGLHQARSNSGSSVAVLDEIKRAERQLRKRSKQILTDTKAIRTLGIVMGVFCVCWLPFFILYVLLAFWPDLPISYEWKSAVTWLGYLNSSLNPCIYALLNKEFKIAFKRVLHCSHPRILVHNASNNYAGNQSPGQLRGRGGLNHSYTQSFSGNMNQAGLNTLNAGRSKRGFLSAVGHGCQMIRELSSSGTFNRDLMEYSFGNGNTTCLLNLSGDTSNMPHLGQRNQGIRISFDFAANDLNLANSPLISNCSTRNPSIASGLEIPIITKSSQKMDNRQLSPQNIPKINKELLTVKRPGRCILPGSISSEDLIYVNAMEFHSGSGESKESTLSAPEHSRTMNSSSSSSKFNSNKSTNQSTFRSKFKLSKYKKKKLKIDQLQSQIKRTDQDENLNENLSTKDKIYLTINDESQKSNSYLNLFRRSTKRKKKLKIDDN